MTEHQPQSDPPPDKQPPSEADQVWLDYAAAERVKELQLEGMDRIEEILPKIKRDKQLLMQSGLIDPLDRDFWTQFDQVIDDLRKAYVYANLAAAEFEAGIARARADGVPDISEVRRKSDGEAPPPASESDPSTTE